MARERQGSSPAEKKLERYGVWVKVRPREVTTTLEAEDSFELTDLESRSTAPAAPAKAEGALTAEEEELLDELEGELGPGKGSEAVSIPDEEPLLSEAEELPDIDSVAGSRRAPRAAREEAIPQLEEAELSLEPVEGEAELPPAAEQVEVPLSESVDVKDHFEDLETLETELTSVTTAAASPRAGSSVEILARIEEELRSIRGDLTQLRNELNGLSRTVKTPGDKQTPQGAKPQGFFDEEEDETIALTGDELDNILNTAEITEEAAAAPQDTLSEVVEPVVGPAEEPVAERQDILSYETPAITLEEPKPREARPAAPSRPAAEVTLDLGEPTLEVGEPEVLEEVIEPREEARAEEVIALEEESPTSGLVPEAEGELPSELVFEELPAEKPAETGDEIPEIDLEALPEIEELPSPATAEAPVEELPERSDETIDLESLDLGEEPTVIQAPEGQESGIEEAEQAVEETAPADELEEGIDLETLSAEVGEKNEQPNPAHVQDLEIGELEGAAEPVEAGEAPEAIEIEFEQGSQASPSAAAQEPVEELLDLEQPAEEKPSGASTPAAANAIPDNLKDEIRTVLKYMDTLLEGLPDDKIQEFASSDYFVMYKKLFEDLGIGD